MDNPKYELSRSQDLEAKYHDAGMMYWLKAVNFMKEQKMFSRLSKGIILDSKKAHDIDTLEDWEIAEEKYRRLYV
jgi:pseudaminic acid cytidylyltransferase